jgi:hypothetical protein
VKILVILKLTVIANVDSSNLVNIFSLSAVEQLAGVTSSDQSHPICDSSDLRISTLLISQAYNKNLSMIKNTALHYKVRALDPNLPLYCSEHSGHQELYGFGGSTTAMGVKPPTPYSDNKDDAAVIIPIGQSYCSINSLDSENVCLNKKNHSDISVKQSILINFGNNTHCFQKTPVWKSTCQKLRGIMIKMTLGQTKWLPLRTI